MTYELPAAVEVGGVEYAIRSDYRAALDILEALSDPDLEDQERAFVVLDIFYLDLPAIPQADYQAALERCFWFLNGGEEEGGKRGPRLMDWAFDFPRIVAPVNRVMGRDIRSLEYLHWWSFLSAYMEIGDCLFSQIVAIRSKKAKHQKLDKSEQAFYKANRQIIDLKNTYSQAEQALMQQWSGQ